MHTNLFSQGHSRQEVRAALSEHQKRDGRIIQVLDLVWAACLFYLVRKLPPPEIAAALVGAFAAISGLRYFVDQSVRNFYLHRLDWEAAPPDEPHG